MKTSKTNYSISMACSVAGVLNRRWN